MSPDGGVQPLLPFLLGEWCALATISPRRHWYVLFFAPKQTPFMSALFLQWPSFFRRDWCQGGRMVSDGKLLLMSLGSLPRFGIIGLKKKEGRVVVVGVQNWGPFQPCVIVVSVLAVIFAASPPLFPHAPSISDSPSFSPSHPPTPFPPPRPILQAGDQTTILSWDPRLWLTTSTHRWILTACTSLASPPTPHPPPQYNNQLLLFYSWLWKPKQGCDFVWFTSNNNVTSWWGWTYKISFNISELIWRTVSIMSANFWSSWMRLTVLVFWHHSLF